MTIGVLLTSLNHPRGLQYLRFPRDSNNLRPAVDGTMKAMILMDISNKYKSILFQKLTELLEQKS
jgi:hypothetical protein